MIFLLKIFQDIMAQKTSTNYASLMVSNCDQTGGADLRFEYVTWSVLFLLDFEVHRKQAFKTQKFSSKELATFLTDYGKQFLAIRISSCMAAILHVYQSVF